jgi:uncharacterized protein YkwD
MARARALLARGADATLVGMRTWFGALLVALGCAPQPTAANVAVPSQPEEALSLAEARAFVLQLINEDREREGLPAVGHDAIAERAAQRHSDDMAHLGYTAHWGSDGSVPEERYTDAGGLHFVQENAACFFDGLKRPLDPDAKFLPSALREIEAAFINEVPPHDGHRKNILKTTHTAVGVGLSQPRDSRQPCMTHEFVDVRGNYAKLPRRAKVGGKLQVSGEVLEPVSFGGVGISRIEPRAPLSVEKLNSTSTYPVPPPYVTYFPEGYQTPKPVKLKGRQFSIDLELSQDRKPGRYGVSIWGAYPKEPEKLVMVSLRIIEVK